jgi:hypothetical protein
MPASEATTRDSSAVQLGTALATVEQDSAADQTALDSLHEHSPESLAAPRTNVAVRGEDVRQEAEDLFGRDATTTFDIDVSNFAGNRRVLEYLEFFQLDARDRFEIWLSRLGRYEGMIRERLRARGLPEDLVYLTLIESGLSNTAVSRGCTACSNAFTAATAPQRSSPVCDETPSDDPSKRRPSDHVSTTLARQRPFGSR